MTPTAITSQLSILHEEAVQTLEAARSGDLTSTHTLLLKLQRSVASALRLVAIQNSGLVGTPRLARRRSLSPPQP
jgi:hypothetical protein